MKKIIIYIFSQMLLLVLPVNAQLYFPDSFEDYHILPADSLNPARVNSTTSLYSPVTKDL